MSGGWGHIWSLACGLWCLALSPLPIFGLVWIFFHLQGCGKEISWLFRMTLKIRNKQIPPEHQEAHQWFGQTLGGKKSFQMIKWERHRKLLIRITQRAGYLDNSPRAEALIQSMCLLLLPSTMLFIKMQFWHLCPSFHWDKPFGNTDREDQMEMDAVLHNTALHLSLGWPLFSTTHVHFPKAVMTQQFSQK